MLKYSAHDNINMLRVLYISHRLKVLKREREEHEEIHLLSISPNNSSELKSWCSKVNSSTCWVSSITCNKEKVEKKERNKQLIPAIKSHLMTFIPTFRHYAKKDGIFMEKRNWRIWLMSHRACVASKFTEPKQIKESIKMSCQPIKHKQSRRILIISP